MPNYNAFREWLKEELAQRDWSLYEFSKRSKVSLSYLSRIIEGGRQPGIATLEKIAAGFGLPPEVVFLRVVGHPRETDKDLDQLQGYFADLPADDRARLLLFARALRESHSR